MLLQEVVKELLFRNQSIVIPGFGAFLLDKIPAHIDKNGIFLSEKSKITFNNLIVENDRILADYLSEKENISYEDAIIAIKDEVVNWKNKLKTESLKFLEIGTLKMNNLGMIEFTPENNLEINTNSFGLNDFSMPNEENSNLDLGENDTNKNTNQEKQNIMSENNELQQDLYNDYNSSNKSSSKAGLFITLAILVVLGGVGYYLGVQYLDVKKKTIDTLTQSEIKQKLNGTSLNIGDFPEVYLPFGEVVMEEEAVEEEVEEPVKRNRTYHIVSGSFKVLENAEKRVLKLKEEGFDAMITQNNLQNLYRVSFGSYQSKNKAIGMLYFIRLGVQEDAWFLAE